MLCQLFVSPSWGHHFIFALHIILPGTTLPQFSLWVVSPFAVHGVWSPTANLQLLRLLLLMMPGILRRVGQQAGRQRLLVHLIRRLAGYAGLRLRLLLCG